MAMILLLVTVVCGGVQFVVPNIMAIQIEKLLLPVTFAETTILAISKTIYCI
jgi:hypothetical protein